MKILQINSFSSYGGPPKIVLGIHQILKSKGYESFIASSRGESPEGVKTIKVGNVFGNYLHALSSIILDKQGFSSFFATKILVRKIKELKPDVIHLHNLHGYYINLPILFNYLKTIDIPIIWTLHDCWAFTGHCAHFDYIGCNKWETGCYDCPQKNEYPKSLFFDNSKWNYKNKKDLFTSLNNMVIVTPSKWLARLAKESFLNKYPIKVINNGIDLDIFSPVKNNFKDKHNIQGKFMVLGVAAVFGERKGLQYFKELSKRLGEEYKIVLVGVTEKYKKKLPSNIIALGRTTNVRELVKIYTAADVFVNPTLEEVLGLTNIEALACGTPVITFNSGGSSECIDSTCGLVVEKGNIDDLQRAIENVRAKSFESYQCIKRSKLYDKYKRFGEYVELYSEVIK